MSYTKLKSYSVNAISNILPIDRETCGEIVDYTLTLSKDHEIQEHLLNLLGESDETLAFLANFIALKNEADSASSKLSTAKFTNKPGKDSSPIPLKVRTQKNLNKAWTPPPTNSSENKLKGRLNNNTTSKTTSELFDLKALSASPKQSKSSKKKRIDNLQDIEAVLNDLELSTNQLDLESSKVTRRKCACMGRRHPLFEVAPNCLNCGKIICAKEGLQPCSFCGKELLSSKDKIEIISLLQEEKNGIESKRLSANNGPQDKSSHQQHQQKNKNSKIVVTLNAGENLWKAQDTALQKMKADKKKNQELLDKIQKEKEEISQQAKELQHYENTSKINPELLKAQERLESLLNFQASGAERTKIIDNASDFEMPNSNSGNMWLSPVERALHLKKQQKQLRKYEENKKSRTGRGNKTVEMVIKDGKVTMVEKHSTGSMKDDDESEDEEIVDLESQVKQDKNEMESSASKSFWDYKNYGAKWEKPVYFTSENSTQPSQDALQASKSRVQFSTDAEQNELLVNLPS